MLLLSYLKDDLGVKSEIGIEKLCRAIIETWNQFTISRGVVFVGDVVARMSTFWDLMTSEYRSV